MEQQLRDKWDVLLKTLPVVTYKKGQVLLFQGEVPQFIYAVKSGIVKAYDLSDQGNEQLIDFHIQGDLFPYNWAVNAMPTALYYYQSVSTCQIYRLRKDEYLKFVGTSKDVIFSELQKHAIEEVERTARLVGVLHSRASDKLLNTLFYLVQKYGVFLGDDVAKINLELTHQDIANLTGLRRETAAVELSKLRKLGVIDYRFKSSYSVDLQQLNKLLGDKNIERHQQRFKRYIINAS